MECWVVSCSCSGEMWQANTIEDADTITNSHNGGTCDGIALSVPATLSVSDGNKVFIPRDV